MVYVMGTYHHGRPYGTSMTRERPHDRGAASGAPTESSEQSQAGQALRFPPEDGGDVEETLARS
jgi:hypothetical protein